MNNMQDFSALISFFFNVIFCNPSFTQKSDRKHQIVLLNPPELMSTGARPVKL